MGKGITKVLETDMYAKNAKAMLPFKIVVEEKTVNEVKEVTVKKIDYRTVENVTLKDESILCVNLWRE